MQIVAVNASMRTKQATFEQEWTFWSMDAFKQNTFIFENNSYKNSSMNYSKGVSNAQRCKVPFEHLQCSRNMNPKFIIIRSISQRMFFTKQALEIRSMNEEDLYGSDIWLVRRSTKIRHWEQSCDVFCSGEYQEAVLIIYQ